jgi:hypothetical protein
MPKEPWEQPLYAETGRKKRIFFGSGILGGCGCGGMLLAAVMVFILFAVVVPPSMPPKEKCPEFGRERQAQSQAARQEPEQRERERRQQREEAAENIPKPAAQTSAAKPTLPPDEKEFVTISEHDPASMYDAINGDEVLEEIPTKTKLEVKSKKDVRQGRIVLTWFEVTYKDKTGWITQYQTTGDLVTESESGKESSIRISGQDDVRLGTCTPEAKKTFKKWALDQTAVTYLEYPQGSDSSIWVTMTPDKYSSKENAESVAVNLARAYKMQTGYEGLVIVTIWHYTKDKVFAKGKF